MSNSSLLGLRVPAHRESGGRDPVCISGTAPEDDRLTFAVSDHWKVVLHPDQTVPGAMLIVSLRHVAKIANLDEDETVEFFQLYRLIERAAESALGASMVNLSCLRNWAYRSENPDPPFIDGRPNPHVHWHVAPRYANPVRFAEARFVDEDFGHELTWRGHRIEASAATAIVERMSETLGLRERNI